MWQMLDSPTQTLLQQNTVEAKKNHVKNSGEYACLPSTSFFFIIGTAMELPAFSVAKYKCSVMKRIIAKAW